MSKPTVSALQATVEQLQAEVREMRATLAEMQSRAVERWVPFPAPQAVSEPIDFAQLMSDMVTAHAAYDESTGWGANTYL